MTSDSVRRSLEKPLSGYRVGGGAQEGLVGGVPASQGVEVDAVGGEVDLCADQAMDPGRCNQVGVAEQLNLAAVVGAPEKDHAALQGVLEIEGPVRREPAPGRSRFKAG